MIFYLTSELMLATLIQRYANINQRYDDCINTISQFIKPFLDNKMSIFEEYGAFNKYVHNKYLYNWSIQAKLN